MAIYHENVRRRLLDQETQELLERRFKELIGLTLIVGGIVLALALGSYEPGDSSLAFRHRCSGFATCSAGLAHPPLSTLFMVVGWGGWGIVLLLLGWGIRFMLHAGTGRLAVRVIVTPVWIAVAAIFASTQIPGSSWVHSFGLGGMFGGHGAGYAP